MAPTGVRTPKARYASPLPCSRSPRNAKNGEELLHQPPGLIIRRARAVRCGAVVFCGGCASGLDSTEEPDMRQGTWACYYMIHRVG